MPITPPPAPYQCLEALLNILLNLSFQRGTTKTHACAHEYIRPSFPHLSHLFQSEGSASNIWVRVTSLILAIVDAITLGGTSSTGALAATAEWPYNSTRAALRIQKSNQCMSLIYTYDCLKGSARDSDFGN